MDRELWTAYSEEIDEDERGPIATGLFSGHLESETASDADIAGEDVSEEAIERVSAHDAVMWARERAAYVIIRVASAWDGPNYSAGEKPVPGLPEWDGSTLVLDRRRHGAWEFVDRTEDDEPISWDVLITAMHVDEQAVPAFATSWKRALESDPPLNSSASPQRRAISRSRRQGATS